MVAPTRPSRDLAASLSRCQLSGSRLVRKLMLGALGLVAIGGFVATSFRSKIVANVATTVDISSGSTGEKNANDSLTVSKEDTLVFTTTHGKIKMILRPDLSPESVDYIRQIVQSKSCQECKFYRAEKDFLLQGIIKNEKNNIKVSKGRCPSGYEEKTDDCPPDKFDCGCHGPIMKRGLVGWAAGATGPDFFIVSYKEPVKHWGTTHTVFGEVKEDASLAVVDKIYALPATKKGLMMLDETIDFTLSLE